MEVHINLWAVLLSGVASMLIGAAYYADRVLGKQWKTLGKIDQKRFEKQMPRVMPLVFIGALITAYVLAYIMFLYHDFFKSGWLISGLATALIVWLGASATSLYIHNSLDQRPSQLTAISLGNRALSFVAMGLILGWLHP